MTTPVSKFNPADFRAIDVEAKLTIPMSLLLEASDPHLHNEYALVRLVLDELADNLPAVDTLEQLENEGITVQVNGNPAADLFAPSYDEDEDENEDTSFHVSASGETTRGDDDA